MLKPIMFCFIIMNYNYLNYASIYQLFRQHIFSSYNGLQWFTLYAMDQYSNDICDNRMK